MMPEWKEKMPVKYVFSDQDSEIQRRFEKMLSQMKPDTVVLECGCATGYLTHYLTEKMGCKVYIVEYEQAAFDIAKQYAAGGICANLLDDQWVEYFHGISFDYILFADVLEHLSDPLSVVKKAASLMNETGKMLVSIPNIGHNDILLKLMDGQWNYTSLGLLDDTHIHFWGINNLQPFFEQAGLRIAVLDAAYQTTQCTEQFANSDHQPDGTAVDLICSRKEGEIYQFVLTLEKQREGESIPGINLINLNKGRKRFIQSLVTKVFWDDGNGFDESRSSEFPFEETEIRDIEMVLEPSIKVVRFDPVENMGCILKELSITLDGEPLSVSYMNGSAWGNGIIFQNNDPQISIALPQSISKRTVHFSAKVYPFKDHVVHQVFTEKRGDLINELIQKQSNIDTERRQKIASLKTQLEETETMLEKERVNVENLNQAVASTNQQVQELAAAYQQQSQKQAQQGDNIADLGKKVEANAKDLAREIENIEKLNFAFKSTSQQVQKIETEHLQQAKHVFDVLLREQSMVQHLIDTNHSLQLQTLEMQRLASEVTARNTTLEKDNQQLQKQMEDLQQQTLETDRLSVEVNEKNAALEKDNRQLKKQVEDLQMLASKINEKLVSVHRELEEVLENRQNEKKHYEDEQNAAMQLYQEKESDLTERIAQMEARCADCDKQLSAMTQARQEQEQQFRAERINHEERIRSIMAENMQLRQAYERSLYDYQIILNSQWWKLTAPGRKVLTAMKGTRIGNVAYRGVRSLKNEGLRKTTDKLKKRLKRSEEPPPVAGQKPNESDISHNSIYDGLPCDLRVHKEDVLVSVIVPNYNHAPYLRERLDSIYNQTYQNFEVILLDDCSKDNSRAILEEYARRYPERTRTAFNKTNVGRVNLQWEKGMNLANGDLIWIAESDDYCELDFLEKLIPAFEKESVQIAYARSVFVKNGAPCWTLEEYLHDLTDYNWREGTFYDTAYNLVRKGFAVKNIIPNVSSALFRKRDSIPARIMKIWENIKLCGDWLFYLDTLKGGVLFYTSKTTNYYRVHDKSTSLDVQKTERYYIESETISKFAAANYDLDLNVFNHTRMVLLEHYFLNNPQGTEARFNELYSLERIRKAASGRKPNVLICGFSFSVGGGEIVPIQLANALSKLDVAVTFANCRYTPTVEQVRKKLPQHIPVVNVNDKIQLIEIAREFGAEIIHTHHASVDQLIAEYVMPTRPQARHIITLHGMYETINDPTVLNNLLTLVTRSCSRFVYIADKNLRVFEENGKLNKSRFVKLPNGMPVIKSAAANRGELGIPDDAFVLCLVSRALFAKGWMEAVEIVNRANRISKREIHLVMVGDGEAYDKLKSSKQSKYIHLVGVQQNTAQYYKMADMGFLPSRYTGESFPLVVIESLLCGKPVLASDLGEVRNMLTLEGNALAGAVFELEDMKIPVAEVARMVADIAQNKKYYASMKKRAPKLASRYDVLTVAQQYLDVYKEALNV